MEKTIKVHRARIMEKMAVRSLADLVRIAERLEIRPSEAQAPSRSAAKTDAGAIKHET